jgi:hypothetical protein
MYFDFRKNDVLFYLYSTIYYLSSRHFEDSAVGLIRGCLEHFNMAGEVSKRESQYQGQEAIEIYIKLLYSVSSESN